MCVTCQSIKEQKLFTTLHQSWSKRFPAMGCLYLPRCIAGIAGCIFLFLFCASKKEKEKRIRIFWIIWQLNKVGYTPLLLPLWDSSVAANDKNSCTYSGRSLRMTRLCGLSSSTIYHQAWYLSRHQGTKALHHFVQQPTGVLPGNGLFIIVPIKIGTLYCFFFVQAKRKKRKELEFLNNLAIELSRLHPAVTTSLRFFSRGKR